MSFNIEIDLVRELHEVAEGVEVPAMPPLPSESHPRPRWQPLLVAAAVVLIVLGAVAGVLALGGGDDAIEPAPSPSPTVATDGATEDPAEPEALSTAPPSVPYVVGNRLFVAGKQVPGNDWAWVTGTDTGWVAGGFDGGESTYSWGYDADTPADRGVHAPAAGRLAGRRLLGGHPRPGQRGSADRCGHRGRGRGLGRDSDRGTEPRGLHLRRGGHRRRPGHHRRRGGPDPLAPPGRRRDRRPRRHGPGPGGSRGHRGGAARGGRDQRRRRRGQVRRRLPRRHLRRGRDHPARSGAEPRRPGRQRLLVRLGRGRPAGRRAQRDRRAPGPAPRRQRPGHAHPARGLAVPSRRRDLGGRRPPHRPPSSRTAARPSGWCAAAPTRRSACCSTGPDRRSPSDRQQVRGRSRGSGTSRTRPRGFAPIRRGRSGSGR